MRDGADLKQRMAETGTAFGCWLNLASPLAAEIVAQAGYDCVLIDLEHGPASVLDALALMQAVQGAGPVPLVRVPWNDPVALKRVLDIGAGGVMVPSVDGPDEAEAAVAACRYPPRGNRGMAAGIVRASGYGADWKAYAEHAHERVLVMCQIESAEAVGNAEAVAAVEGVDLLFVGPFDLSASLGFLGEPDHAEVRAMIGKVETAAKTAGKLLGGIPTPERSAADLVAAGYDLILADSDLALLRDSARAGIGRLRGLARSG